MAIQEFDLGQGHGGVVYPLMEQFMASMSKNAEEIGNNIRASMLRTEATNQTKDMSAALGSIQLFNQDGTSRPDSMSKLMSVMAAHPLGASTPVGQMMFQGLGKQIEYNMPIGGQSGQATDVPATSAPYGGGGGSGGASVPANTGAPVAVTSANPDMPVQDNGVDMNASLFGDQTNLITGKPGIEAGGAPTVSTNGQQGASSPVDMFREQITAIDKRMAVLQSMVPRVVTRGNHVTFNATQNQIDRLQTQKDTLLKESAIQIRSDSRETRAQDKSDRDERRMDMMQQRIDDAAKRGDDTTAARLRTEHRSEIKDQIAPVEKDVAVLNSQLRDARKTYETYSGAVTQETDPRKLAGWAKKAREAQLEMQDLQSKIKPKQDQIAGLTQRLSDLDKAPVKQPTQADVSQALSEANGDRDKAKELLKTRGYAVD